MTAKSHWRWVLGVAIAVRLLWFSGKAGLYDSDELVLNLEPGHLHITGDGHLTATAGLGHWLLSAFWAGWIEMGRALHFQRWELHRFLTFHAALLSTLIVPAVYRIVRAATKDTNAAWTAAWIVAIHPALGFFAPHTSNEVLAMLLMAFACAFWLEGRGSSLRRTVRIAVLLVLAAVCWLPAFSSSPLRPWYFYATTTWRWFGVGVVLAPLALLGWRRDRRLVAIWLVPLLVLSLVPSKQDRLLLPLVPLFLASLVAGLGVFASIAVRARFVLAAFSVASLVAVSVLPPRTLAGTFQAQAWIGTQEDATGVLIENSGYGYLLLDRSVPQVRYTSELAGHRRFNYVVAATPELVTKLAHDKRFKRAIDFEGTIVYRRER